MSGGGGGRDPRRVAPRWQTAVTMRLVFAAGAVAFLALCQTASASVTIGFDRHLVRPGALVHAYVSDPKGHPVPTLGPEPVHGIRVYLATLEWAQAIGNP